MEKTIKIAIVISLIMYTIPAEARRVHHGYYPYPTYPHFEGPRWPRRPVIRLPVEPCPATGCLTIDGHQIVQRGKR